MSALIIHALAGVRYALLLTASYWRFILHAVGLRWEAPRNCAVVWRPACRSAMASRRFASVMFLISTLCVSAWAQTPPTPQPPPAAQGGSTALPTIQVTAPHAKLRVTRASVARVIVDDVAEKTESGSVG